MDDDTDQEGFEFDEPEDESGFGPALLGGVEASEDHRRRAGGLGRSARRLRRDRRSSRGGAGRLDPPRDRGSARGS